MANSTLYVQEVMHVQTHGRGTIDITGQLVDIVKDVPLESGLCHVFVHHTSASLIVCENADPDVRVDLETFMTTLVPDGDPMFVHTAEGPDDMPAHVRSTVTQAGLTLPISSGSLALGIWQGIYLWEHRTSGHDRRITVTVHGLSKN